MKKLIVAFVLISISISSIAQIKISENINTKWPYLFEEFIPAKVYFDGKNVEDTKINVELARNVYHILDDKDVVREFNRMVDIDSIIISNKLLYFRYVDIVYEQLALSKGYRLLVKRVADLTGLNEGGAYGSSTQSSAVTELTSLYVTNNSNMHIGTVIKERKMGQKFPVKKSYYLYSLENGDMIRATKKELQKTFGKDLVNKKIKEGKLKLRNEEDLIKLMGLI